jgi:hypothetical protein
LSLSWARPIQSTPPHPISPRSILVFLVVYFSLAIPPITYTRSSSPYMLHAPPISSSMTRSFQLYLAKSTNQKAPPSCHFISLWSKYSPQHPVLKYPSPLFLS